MKHLRLRYFHLVSAATVLGVIAIIVAASSGQPARAQSAKTIKIIVPFPAGGNTDTLARLLGEQIGRAQGLTMLIENRPGAATVIATEAVARAAADGNTLLINAGGFVTNPHVRKVNYDPLTSFQPVCSLASVPTAIVVNNASPYRTLADLLDAARARPGDLTWASTGTANGNQIVFEMLRRAADVNMTYVPYPGGAPVVTAVLGGHVTAALVDYAAFAEHLRTGMLRVLATASRTRIAPLPELPTVAESGFRDIEYEVWNGLFAPARTPKETVSRLAGWFTAALQAPEVRAKLAAQGYAPVGMCGAEFSEFIRKQYETFGRVIREANIKAE